MQEGTVFTNFRFGPVLCASYSSPALDTTNLPREPAREIGESPMTRSFRLTGPVSRVKSREVFNEIAEFLDKHLGKQGVSQQGYDGDRSTPRSVL